MKKNRLWGYLILNIIVSALTTLSVLVIWELVHQVQTPVLALPFAPNPTQSIKIEETIPDVNETTLMIDNVYSVGHLQDEVVVIKRVGEGELWLTGWKMTDEQKHEYIFPRLSLNKGEISIHTQAGIDSAMDLHWGMPNAVWTLGEKVRIFDPLGNLRAEYTIP